MNELYRQPRNLSETGLTDALIKELLLKHLYDGVVLDLAQLRERLKLSGDIIEDLLNKLRKDQRVQSHSALNNTSGIRYQLTELGRADASSALLRSGYIGPAPISLNHYCNLVAEQSIFSDTLTREQIQTAFDGVVIDQHNLDLLGPALYSGLPILVYGQAGTGKTYICKKLANLLGGNMYLPYSIAVDREVIQFFDPLIHSPVEEKADHDVMALNTLSNDPRLIRCHRPVAISGGELTMDRLELNYDPVARTTNAPIQLKANNGIYIIDDMGRQSMPPMELFNRWIVPMEERKDFLTLVTGKHFSVPFDCVLIFSTNLHPTDLADEAFLRRLGYKLHFASISENQFTAIWEDLVKEWKITVEPYVLSILFVKFQETGRDLLPCHPRDLMRIALDIGAYLNNEGIVSQRNIMLAWDTYFINLKEG